MVLRKMRIQIRLRRDESEQKSVGNHLRFELLLPSSRSPGEALRFLSIKSSLALRRSRDTSISLPAASVPLIQVWCTTLFPVAAPLAAFAVSTAATTATTATVIQAVHRRGAAVYVFVLIFVPRPSRHVGREG